jgi:ElaB/YqjD/DUF883 family membrane-anchored ribosome-binding protein
MRSQRNGVAEAAEQARNLAEDTARSVGDAAANMAARAGAYTREARRQASTAAQTTYDTGGDIVDVVEGFARENLWGSLLIAAAVGYGLACVIKTARR